MRPVDQTTFGFPGGNCFSACVASILETRLEDVPYFMDVDDWLAKFASWLDEIGTGLYPMLLNVTEEWCPLGIHVLSGQSPRRPGDVTALHSVVAIGSSIVHDPHPSRAGLLTRQDALVLVPRNPATHYSIPVR